MCTSPVDMSGEGGELTADSHLIWVVKLVTGVTNWVTGPGGPEIRPG
jgi:hypothetical protein